MKKLRIKAVDENVGVNPKDIIIDTEILNYRIVSNGDFFVFICFHVTLIPNFII